MKTEDRGIGNKSKIRETICCEYYIMWNKFEKINSTMIDKNGYEIEWRAYIDEKTIVTFFYIIVAENTLKILKNLNIFSNFQNFTLTYINYKLILKRMKI